MDANTFFGATAAPYGLENYHSETMESPLMPQAEIHMRAAFPPNLVAERTNCTARTGEDQRIGAFTGGTSLNIIPGEPVFMMRTGQGAIYDSGTATESRPLAFTSFDGMSIQPGMTQEEFERQTPVLGWAVTQYMAERLEQLKVGFTVRVAGSGSTRNNSSKSFNFGDLIRVRRPHLSASLREQDDTNRPTVEGVHGGAPRAKKQTGIVEPYTHTGYGRYVRDALRWFFSEQSGGSKIRLSTLAAVEGEPEYRKLGAREQLGLALGRVAAAGLVQAAIFLDATGLMSWNDVTRDDGNGAWKNSQAAYDAYVAGVLETNNFRDLCRGYVDVSAKGGPALQAVNDIERAAMLKRRGNRASYLASLLGLLPFDQNRPHLRPCVKLVEQATALFWGPFAPRSGLSSTMKASNYTTVPPSRKHGLNAAVVAADLDYFSRQLDLLQYDLSQDLLDCIMTPMLMDQSNIIGVALGPAKSGDMLDYF